MNTADSLEETVAYVALRRVQNRYADIVTRRAWDELHDIMCADVVVSIDLGDRTLEYRGVEELGGFISKQLEQFDFFEFVILNTVLKIDFRAGRAAVRMYMQEARQTIETRQRSDTFGIYHDVFVDDPDRGWLLSHRRYRSYARTNTGADPAHAGGLEAGGSADLTVLGIHEISLTDLLS